MTVVPAPSDARSDADTASSLTRRAVIAVINAVSFGLADVIPSARHRWLVRAAIHGSSLGWSMPKMRRALPRLRQSWQRLTTASSQSRRIVLAATVGITAVVSAVSFGWYRLLVRCAGHLAARGLRYPRLTTGLLSETLAFMITARLQRARLQRTHRAALPSRLNNQDEEEPTQ